MIAKAAYAALPLSVLLSGCTLLFEPEPGEGTDRDVGFVAVEYQHAESSSSLNYLVSTPDVEDRAMLVAVLLGAGCSASVTPIIESVSYGGVELRQVASVQGVPCGASGTRSEQWLLEAPTVGRHEISIRLSSSAASIHSNAMVFQDVDQAAPIRAFAADYGAGETSQLTIESAPGDLVVNVVGQGSSILDPGEGETVRFRANVDSSNTLNNSAGSTAPGAPQVESTWTFGSSDQWQSTSVSLRPVP